MAEQIEFDAIQGNILNGYGLDHVAHLLLHAETTDAARRCLDEIVDDVTTAADWSPERPLRAALNVAVTYSGFERLGVRAPLLAHFPEAFRQGPRKRAAALGDIGPSRPKHWEEGLGTGEGSLMVTLNAQKPQDLDHAMALRDDLERVPGLRLVGKPHVGQMLKHNREHFGYADGFAQPDIEGVDRRSRRRTAAARGGGKPVADSRWEPLKIGEFVLGYPDEDAWVEKLPDPHLIRNGTYVVYRKLKQDVARFRRGLAEAAKRHRSVGGGRRSQGHRPLARRHAARAEPVPRPQALV
jgi:deferrochelatase/peroxidase EfeB